MECVLSDFKWPCQQFFGSFWVEKVEWAPKCHIRHVPFNGCVLKNPTFCSIVESPKTSEFLSTKPLLKSYSVCKSTVVSNFSRIDHLECNLNISKVPSPWSWALRRLWSMKKINAPVLTERSKFNILTKNEYFEFSHSPRWISPVLQWMLISAFCGQVFPVDQSEFMRQLLQFVERFFEELFCSRIVHESSAYGRGGIIAYECNSHSPNIKALD